jgi:hypothetical protein
MKSVFMTCVLAAAALTLPAADDYLRGPVAGLIVDAESGSIRPILGSAGAAYAGAAAVRGATYTSASPDGERALVAAQGTLFLVHRLDAGAPVWLTLREDASDLGLSAFTADGAAVAVHETAHHQIELWNNLRDEPASGGVIDLNTVAGRLVSLALHADGATVFATFQETDDSAAVYRMRADAAPLLLASLERAGALELHRDALFAADRGRNEVLRISAWDVAPAVMTVASHAHGIEDPVGIAVTANGDTLFIASAGTRQVLAVDIQQQALKASLDLSFQPSRLERSGSVLLLAAGVPGVQPAQVLDPARFEVYFIPVSVLPEAIATGASAH